MFVFAKLLSMDLTNYTISCVLQRAKFEELKAAFLKDQFLQITPFHNKSRPVATIHNNTSLFKQSVKRKYLTFTDSLVHYDNGKC